MGASEVFKVLGYQSPRWAFGRHAECSFFMDRDDNDFREDIRRRFAEYADMLVEMLKESKDRGTDDPVHQSLFAMYGDCLCCKDELDAYVSVKNGIISDSLLGCDALNSYEDVFSDLATAPIGSEPSSLAREDSTSSGSVRMTQSCYTLLREYLRMFGRFDCNNQYCEPKTWIRIAAALFPHARPESLRRSYYKYQSQYKLPPIGSTRRDWTFDEDFTLISCIEANGRGELGIQQVYLALEESRGHDEIVNRVIGYFPRPLRKYRKSIRGPKNVPEGASIETTRAPSEAGSEWSEDDGLLDVAEFFQLM